MLKEETLDKIKSMLKELGWSDEVINQYCMDTFENVNEYQTTVTVK
jgi:hypothetical protein